MPPNQNSPAVRRMAMWLLALGLAVCPVISNSGVASEVVFAWDQNPEPDIAAYLIHYGTATGNYTQTLDAGNQTTATIGNLAPGTYYCAVTAKNLAGLESLPSEELSFEVRPAAPVLAGMTDGQSLNGPAAVELHVSVSASAFSRIEIWAGETMIGEAPASAPDVTWQSAPAGEYQLVVKSFDNAGNAVTSVPIQIHIVQPALDDLRWTEEQEFEFVVKGAAGRMQHIWYSDDLRTWRLLHSEVNTTGSMTIRDGDADGLSHRFYRLASD